MTITTCTTMFNLLVITIATITKMKTTMTTAQVTVVETTVEGTTARVQHEAQYAMLVDPATPSFSKTYHALSRPMRFVPSQVAKQHETQQSNLDYNSITAHPLRFTWPAEL